MMIYSGEQIMETSHFIKFSYICIFLDQNHVYLLTNYILVDLQYQRSKIHLFSHAFYLKKH